LENDAPRSPIASKVGMGGVVVIVALLALLAGAFWFAIWAWTAIEIEMPAGGYVMIVLGVVISLIVGCGLMALMFYSSRRGYDDAARGDRSGDDGR
jgi:hypothetical protein